MFRIKLIMVITLLAVVTLAGCSTSTSVKEFKEYLDDPQALRVVAQICVPNMTTYFDSMTVDVTDLPANISSLELQKLFQEANAYKTGKNFTNPYRSNSVIREYQTARPWNKPTKPTDYPYYAIGFSTATNVKGIMSTGSGSEYLEDSTEKDQPVFVAYLHERPEDIIAVSVTTPKTENNAQREFWFKLPKDIKKEKYTNWMGPVSEEGQNERSAKYSTWWLLVHGKDMPIYEVKGDAPKIRYILMNYPESAKHSEFGMRAINAAKLQHMRESPNDNEYHHYVPEKSESIPPC